MTFWHWFTRFKVSCSCICVLYSVFSLSHDRWFWCHIFLNTTCILSLFTTHVRNWAKAVEIESTAISLRKADFLVGWFISRLIRPQLIVKNVKQRWYCKYHLRSYPKFKTVHSNFATLQPNMNLNQIFNTFSFENNTCLLFP